MKEKKTKKSFLKKADTTAVDKYTCGSCNKFGTRWCPFVGTETEPTAETRACEHFDKSYTIPVENEDHKGISIIMQEENLYRHYETPEVIKVEKDREEPFSHACGQCTKFGTIECPYLEKKSDARACQAFSWKAPDGDQVQMQPIDYESLTYDMPNQGPVHPSNPSRRDLVEYPFQFKTLFPQPFRVAQEEGKTVHGRLNEKMENALNDFILGFQKLRSSGLVEIETASVDASFFEQNKYVVVVGNLKQDPEIQVYYRMSFDLAPARAIAFVDSGSGKALDVSLINPNEDVVGVINKMIQKLSSESNRVASDKNLKKNHKANE